MLGFSVPTWITNAYRHVGIFAFGTAMQQLTTDIAKYSIGRLRPHFFSVSRIFWIILLRMVFSRHSNLFCIFVVTIGCVFFWFIFLHFLFVRSRSSLLRYKLAGFRRIKVLFHILNSLWYNKLCFVFYHAQFSIRDSSVSQSLTQSVRKYVRILSVYAFVLDVVLVVAVNESAHTMLNRYNECGFR